MFCSQCGAKVPDGARFCSSCGARLETVTEPVQQVSQADETFKRGMQLKEARRFSEALPLFEQAAAQGHTVATYWAGMCYLSTGIGIQQNVERAMGYLYNAASKNHADARKFFLDYLWALYGEAIKTKNYAPIIPYLKMAAELGDASAQAKLSAFYLGTNNCLPKDLQAARYWAERSAAQGHQDGIAMLQVVNSGI